MKVTRLIDELTATGSINSENTKVALLIGCLTKDYDSIRTTIEMNQLNGASISFSSVITMIRNQARSLADNYNKTEIHYVNFKKKSVKCFNCNRFGHIAKYCHDKTESKYKRKPKDDDKEENTKMPTRKLSVKRQNYNSVYTKKASFILDNGASTHAVNDIKLLRNIHLMDNEIEITGIDEGEHYSILANQKGTVTIKTDDQDTFTFEAIYAPQLKHNYFSLFVFGQQPYECAIICNGICTLESNNNIIARAIGDQTNRVYIKEFTVIVITFISILSFSKIL